MDFFSAFNGIDILPGPRGFHDATRALWIFSWLSMVLISLSRGLSSCSAPWTLLLVLMGADILVHGAFELIMLPSCRLCLALMGIGILVQGASLFSWYTSPVPWTFSFVSWALVHLVLGAPLFFSILVLSP